MAGSYVDATNQFVLQKLADNTLHFTIVTSGGTSDLVVAAAAYGWRAYDWVHIIMQWDDALSLADQQVLYVNGVQPAHTDPAVDYNSALLTLDTDFYLGNIFNRERGLRRGHLRRAVLLLALGPGPLRGDTRPRRSHLQPRWSSWPARATTRP